MLCGCCIGILINIKKSRAAKVLPSKTTVPVQTPASIADFRRLALVLQSVEICHWSALWEQFGPNAFATSLYRSDKFWDNLVLCAVYAVLIWEQKESYLPTKRNSWSINPCIYSCTQFLSVLTDSTALKFHASSRSRGTVGLSQSFKVSIRNRSGYEVCEVMVCIHWGDNKERVL